MENPPIKQHIFLVEPITNIDRYVAPGYAAVVTKKKIGSILFRSLCLNKPAWMPWPSATFQPLTPMTHRVPIRTLGFCREL
jgi:hypothetical protein